MKNQNALKTMKTASNQYPTFRQYVSKHNNEQETENFFRQLVTLPIDYIDRNILNDYLSDCRPDLLEIRDEENFLDKIESELATPNF